ncbi:uncharacterized protein LOC100898949 [Galendromus occidentalis]|uniref:Uncharacterized protein LOC100898949 n=1 Tax=Galendromus occidentalis TaxID=34638 RepID=A0AAJ6QYA0_9ACAR|nr:uncharacterized protein LOC100898949 [Galendromus occidentalis]
MAGLYILMAENDCLCRLEELSDRHVVVDGSNLQYYFLHRNHKLSNLPGYEESVRKYFRYLLNSRIVPHVFFKGPLNDRRKQERLLRSQIKNFHRLLYTPCAEFDQASPIGTGEVFRGVLNSLGIRSIQVPAGRDYLDEITSHAKFMNAFVISGNTRLFLKDIPMGVVCPSATALVDFAPMLRCTMRVFHYDSLCAGVELDSSRNPHAITMWGTVLFNRDIFEPFTIHFFKRFPRGLPKFYPKSSSSLRRSFPEEIFQRKRSHIDLLQFFLENTAENAQSIVLSQLSPACHEMAILLLHQDIQSQSIEACNVLERLEEQIEQGTHCDKHLPRWLLRRELAGCGILPDTLTDRTLYLMCQVEDFERESAHNSSLLLRRIIYGLLYPACDHGDRGIAISEIDRSELRIQETQRTPLWTLWDAERSVCHALPRLDEMENLPGSERLRLFLMSMGLGERWPRSDQTHASVYVTAVLKFWIAYGADITKTDLLRVLLTVLLIEWKYRKSSEVFQDPVELNNEAMLHLGMEFHPGCSISQYGSFACMHPLAQLQSVTLFAAILHKLFMQPLGAESDSIQRITSEVVFYHICQRTKDFGAAKLERFVLAMVEKSCHKIFERSLEMIWNRDHR